MPSDPIRELPSNYYEARHEILTEPKRLLRLNLLGVVVLLAAAGFVLLWNRAAAPLRPPDPSGITVPGALSFIIGVLLVLPLHELLHGLAIRAFGHRARYGFKFETGVLYTTADGALFRKHEYIVVALAPVVVISVVGLALLVTGPAWLSDTVSIIIIVNAGGAVGDLWMAWTLLRYDRSALIRDEQDGFRIYLPAKQET